jgi:hypothetical protein
MSVVIADKGDALESRLFEELFTEPVSPHVIIEDKYICGRIYLLYFQGVLDSLTATNPAAIRSFFITGADALNHDYVGQGIVHGMCC